MGKSGNVILNTQLWALLCATALGLMVVLSLLAHLAGPYLWGAAPEDADAAGRFMLPVFFSLFLAFGFCAVPLMTSLFVGGLERVWAAAGLLERPLHARIIALLRRRHVQIVLLFWALFLAGLVIAAPHAMRAWALEQAPPVSGQARGS